MLTLLATGKLLKDPIRRTSQHGNTYATAVLSAATDEGPALVSLVAFNAVAERLLHHAQGDSLSVLGRARMTSWEKDGEVKQGLSLIVDKLLSVYELSKRREALNEHPRTRQGKPTPDLVDDQIPF